MKPKPKMTMQLVYVTPPMATEYLAAMPPQRRPIQRHTSRIATDMREGRWIPTHEAIAFNCDGTLRDGQHRLMGIVRSGEPQWLWVCHNVPNEAMAVIDIGVTRSAAQALQIMGGDFDSRDVATATRMMISVATDMSRSVTRSALIEFCNDYGDAIRFARMPHRAIGNHACVRGAIARAWYTQDHDRLHEFMQAMTTGVIGREEDAAAALLIRVLQQKAARLGNRTAKHELYCKAQSALVNFLARKPITRLVAVETEQFPIPGDEEV